MFKELKENKNVLQNRKHQEMEIISFFKSKSFSTSISEIYGSLPVAELSTPSISKKISFITNTSYRQMASVGVFQVCHLLM